MGKKTKICACCKEDLPLENFGPRKGRGDNLQYYCKPCMKQKRKEYYRNNTSKETVLYTLAKARAKAKGVPFSITKEDIKIPTHCPILGIELKLDNTAVQPDSPSLDKINPALGYVPGNVWVISHRANAMKQDADTETLLAFARAIIEIFG